MLSDAVVQRPAPFIQNMKIKNEGKRLLYMPVSLQIASGTSGNILQKAFISISSSYLETTSFPC